MKIAKPAVFCGAAASWTGDPSGRTRSLFPALTLIPAQQSAISWPAVGPVLGGQNSQAAAITAR